MAERNQGTKTLLTAKDLADMGEEAEFCELVDGELVRLSPSFLPEARVVRTTLLLLGAFVLQHRLGEIFGPDLGYELTPHRVRAPDVSPDVKYGYLQRKIRDHFEAGVRLLWIVDPAMQTVTVHRSPVDLRVLTTADTLSGEDVLPGFSCPVAELFA
jgi:Uma2 family endonuclease